MTGGPGNWVESDGLLCALPDDGAQRHGVGDRGATSAPAPAVAGIAPADPNRAAGSPGPCGCRDKVQTLRITTTVWCKWAPGR